VHSDESQGTSEFQSASGGSSQSLVGDSNSETSESTSRNFQKGKAREASALDEAVESRKLKLLEDLKLIFANFIGNAGGKVIPDPFSVTNSKDPFDKRKVLWLPRNAEAVLKTNAAMGVLTYLWSETGNDVAFSDKDVTLQKLDDDSVKFWKAMMKELMRDDPPESLSFRGSNSAERGTSAARSEYMKIYLKNIKKTHLLNYVSPALYTKAGANTVEWFTVYLQKAGGLAETTQKKSFASCMKQVISEIAMTRFSIWSQVVISFNAPTSEVMKGLHRTKTVKEGRSTKIVPLHPNRPSERAGVLFEWEKLYLQKIEKPFDDYRDIVADLQKESGVSVSKIEDLRTLLKGLINEQWTVVQKNTAVLTAREKALAALVKEDGVGNGKATKENFKLFMANLRNHRLVGEDITKLCSRIKLFGLLREIASGTAEVVLADATRVQQVANQLIIIRGEIDDESSIDAAINEVAGVLTASVRTSAPNPYPNNRWQHLDPDVDYDNGIAFDGEPITET